MNAARLAIRSMVWVENYNSVLDAVDLLVL